MKNFLFALLCSLTTLAVSAAADPKAAYEDVKAGKAVLVDVREKEEVALGVIQGAKWFPLSQIEANPERSADQLKSLLGDSKLYVYCRSGRRSALALEKLAPFKLTGDNLGGFEDLVKAGLPSGKLP